MEKSSSDWAPEPVAPEPTIPQTLAVAAAAASQIQVPRNKPGERQAFRQQPPPMKVHEYCIKTSYQLIIWYIPKVWSETYQFVDNEI